MTDKWFDEYNYEVVVHKKHIPKKLLDIWDSETAVQLDPWDPMEPGLTLLSNLF